MRTPRACVCGCTYAEFRTGLTFGEVRHMLWDQMDRSRPGWFRQKRRSAVLGFWHEMKIHMFELNHGYCEEQLQ